MNQKSVATLNGGCILNLIIEKPGDRQSVGPRWGVGKGREGGREEGRKGGREEGL